uniref:Uncharacterized protein n=1 Tax=Arundo donax TaxID=35708 RepID=A0A0A9D0J5_ARUDO
MLKNNIERTKIITAQLAVTSRRVASQQVFGVHIIRLKEDHGKYREPSPNVKDKVV